jgi:biopolymer transport protein ExbB
MKKLLLITACIGLLSAEEPQNESLNLLSLEKNTQESVQPPASSEEYAKNEIESFFEAEKTAPSQETAEGSVTFSQTSLPNSSVATQAPLETSAPALNTESPKIIDDSLEVAPVTPAAALPSQDTADLAALEMQALEAEMNAPAEKDTGVMIDLSQVFAGSPTIYTTLLFLSVGSFCIWLYSIFALRTNTVMPQAKLQALKEKLLNKQYDEALAFCQQNKSILFKMMASGIVSRGYGQNVMLDMMKSEGRRASTAIWQKTALLNDVAIIAPMIGLLGTVLGMFYAFYDLNRSMESVTTLFDGLGISVGTTVGGLIVAIVAMLFHSIAKYRLVRQLTLIENEANALANLIDTKGETP